MKRYKGNVKVYWVEGAQVEMKEDPEGDWVKWKDIKHLIEVSNSREKLIELMCPFLERNL